MWEIINNYLSKGILNLSQDLLISGILLAVLKFDFDKMLQKSANSNEYYKRLFEEMMIALSLLDKYLQVVSSFKKDLNGKNEYYIVLVNDEKHELFN